MNAVHYIVTGAASRLNDKTTHINDVPNGQSCYFVGVVNTQK